MAPRLGTTGVESHSRFAIIQVSLVEILNYPPIGLLVFVWCARQSRIKG